MSVPLSIISLIRFETTFQLRECVLLSSVDMLLSAEVISYPKHVLEITSVSAADWLGDITWAFFTQKNIYSIDK